MEFGERVKKRREELNLSQTELANKLELSSSAVSLIEKGERKPSFELLSKIADSLEVTTDYLMGKEISENDELYVAFRGAGDLKPEFKDMLKDYVKLLRSRQEKEGKKDGGN